MGEFSQPVIVFANQLISGPMGRDGRVNYLRLEKNTRRNACSSPIYKSYIAFDIGGQALRLRPSAQKAITRRPVENLSGRRCLCSGESSAGRTFQSRKKNIPIQRPK
jgi:hypothetical protein